MTATTLIREHQRLATSGARTALPFVLDGETWLAVPQLAKDVADEAPHMNGGDSDVDLVLYRWEEAAFVEADRLPCPGGEDVTVFDHEGETYMAVASIRTGHGPYDANTDSWIYRREGDVWAPYQAIATFGAKQWHAFAFDGRLFLALAQGLTLPQYTARGPATSRIFEWRAGRFEPFQELDGRWGYNWAFFEWAGEQYLGYADHVGPSLLHRWDGRRFVPFQTLADTSGRAFRFFEQDGHAWLAFASIDGDTTLHRWNGERFADHQVLDGPGGREFELIRTGDELHLVLVRFIEGTPRAPRTDLVSRIYRWTGDGFEGVGSFPTFGATDATLFHADGKRFLAVSNSLTPDIRFRQDSIVYEIAV